MLEAIFINPFFSKQTNAFLLRIYFKSYILSIFYKNIRWVFFSHHKSYRVVFVRCMVIIFLRMETKTIYRNKWAVKVIPVFTHIINDDAISIIINLKKTTRISRNPFILLPIENTRFQVFGI